MPVPMFDSSKAPHFENHIFDLISSVAATQKE